MENQHEQRVRELKNRIFELEEQYKVMEGERDNLQDTINNLNNEIDLLEGNSVSSSEWEELVSQLI